MSAPLGELPALAAGAAEECGEEDPDPEALVVLDDLPPVLADADVDGADPGWVEEVPASAAAPATVGLALLAAAPWCEEEHPPAVRASAPATASKVGMRTAGRINRSISRISAHPYWLESRSVGHPARALYQPARSTAISK